MSKTYTKPAKKSTLISILGKYFRSTANIEQSGKEGFARLATSDLPGQSLWLVSRTHKASLFPAPTCGKNPRRESRFAQAVSVRKKPGEGRALLSSCAIVLNQAAATFHSVVF
jgi:hypothetical protein